MMAKMNRLNIRPELDKFKAETIAKANLGECEGDCSEHSGNVVCVRVFNKVSGTDWGYFSYCEEAIKEDRRRGMDFIL